jgi:hypothetical protein
MKIIGANVTGSFILNGVDVTTTIQSSSIWSGSVASSITSLNSTTSSLNSATASLYNYTSSNTMNVVTLFAASASLNANVTDIKNTTSSLNAFTGSASSRLSSIELTTGSLSSTVSSSVTRISALENASGSAITRLNTLEAYTGSYATTGSNVFSGTQTITGSLFISNNLVVQGSSSIQNITASSVSIGTNTIILNTDTPAVRFGGIKVYDSGSTGATGSLFWDSQNDKWIYQNASGSTYSGGMLISGPRNTGSLGEEVGVTNGRIIKGLGGDHIGDSIMTESGTTITVSGNLSATSLTGSIAYLNLTGVPTLISSSAQVSYTGLSNIPTGIISGSVSYTALSNIPVGIVSGSGQVAIASTSGFGSYINQALLTTSTPTFATLTSNGAIIAINAGSYSATLGTVQSSWAGSTTYPTLYGSHVDRWVMHINPHISYVSNGVNGFAGSSTGAKIRMASNPAADNYWDIGIGASGQGADKYSVGRNDTYFFSITSGGISQFSGRIILGTFPNSTTNTGEAWIGRASDRNSGTMTVQLGGNSSSGRSFEVVDYAWSVVLFSVSSGGTATASGDVVAYSDARVKANVKPIDSSLEKVLKLTGVTYNRTDLEDKSTKIGFIAQEVEKVVPEVVTYDGEKDRYGVSYGNVTALLVEAIKEQQIQIEELKSIINGLTK